MTKKELIFLGPPACGKGTQTEKLAKYLNFPHVDTGSLLRAEIKNETPDGKIAKSFIDKGNLVPADLVAKIIKTDYLKRIVKKALFWTATREVSNKRINLKLYKMKSIMVTR